MYQPLGTIKSNKMKKVIKWVKRIILGLLALIFLLLIVGFIFEHVARTIDSKKIKPTGNFTNVGNHQLHYIKKGVGGPTVVFESGIDLGGHVSWKFVQDEISKYTTTLSYDRAGILWSERGNNPKSLSTNKSDLQNLLINTKCPKPYIIVGHSFAGITLRKLIDEQKEDILGVIFVDVSHPDQMNRFSEEMLKMMELPPRWILEIMFNCGFNRLLFQDNYPKTSENDSINLIANKFSYKGIDAIIETFQNLESMAKEASLISNFDSIPLTIITGCSPNRNIEISDENLRIESTKVWNELQKELLNLSANSKQILANESGHYVQTEQPEIVIDAIEALLNQNKPENE